ncbi:hypothetical protein FHS57_000973 [Runella defluvii]|uniref:Uncharacterized protein n=1 Tax=Runella defluvii TaxID=370973 RepID=A0A7W5ZGZ3_9BACT|nr:hypothetical protein [Runella defluvii]MBB3836991.1 hypothetical protein [Runella defluvii]
MKPNKPNTYYQPNEIDSGFINSQLSYFKNEYPQDVLTLFKGSLMTLLIQKEIVTIAFSEENASIIEQLDKENTADLAAMAFFRYWYEGGKLDRKPYITHFSESCVVNKDEEIFGFDSFDLYFALRLNLTDLMQVFSFLDFQLDRNFGGDFTQFKAYLEQLIRKYKPVFLKPLIIESVESWLTQDRKPLPDKTITKVSAENDSFSKKLEIGLPKLKPRDKNDGITSLTINQTALLFSLLREHKVIFKDESYQSKENIYKAIQVLTGYNRQNIKTAMLDDKFSESDKEVVQNLINKLTF